MVERRGRAKNFCQAKFLARFLLVWGWHGFCLVGKMVFTGKKFFTQKTREQRVLVFQAFGLGAQSLFWHPRELGEGRG
jgi:hypothetical protein